jgi:hypothetical protein
MIILSPNMPKFDWNWHIGYREKYIFKNKRHQSMLIR